MNHETAQTETKRNQQGFTLVELLIVIIILGILATIVVFSVRGLTGKANTNACKIDRRSIDTAIEAAYADSGTYPADMAAIVAGGWMDKASTKWTVAVTTAGVKTWTPIAPCKTTDVP